MSMKQFFKDFLLWVAQEQIFWHSPCESRVHSDSENYTIPIIGRLVCSTHFDNVICYHVPWVLLTISFYAKNILIHFLFLISTKGFQVKSNDAYHFTKSDRQLFPQPFASHFMRKLSICQILSLANAPRQLIFSYYNFVFQKI